MEPSSPACQDLCLALITRNKPGFNPTSKHKLFTPDCCSGKEWYNHPSSTRTQKLLQKEENPIPGLQTLVYITKTAPTSLSQARLPLPRPSLSCALTPCAQQHSARTVAVAHQNCVAIFHLLQLQGGAHGEVKALMVPPPWLGISSKVPTPASAPPEPLLPAAAKVKILLNYFSLMHRSCNQCLKIAKPVLFMLLSGYSL